MFFHNLKCLLLPLSGRAETNPRYQLEVDCISKRDYFFLKITISQRQEERAIKSCDELFGNRESLCYFFPPLSLILQRYQTQTNSFKSNTRTDTPSIALTCHAVVVGFFFSSHLLYQSKCIMKVRILCPPVHSIWQSRGRKIHILLPHKKYPHWCSVTSMAHPAEVNKSRPTSETLTRM